MSYDHENRVVNYHFRGETFFLRRVRAVDDQLTLPEGIHVHDVLSALLNYVDGQWKGRGDGSYETWLVRCRTREGERPDDVDRNAPAELVPFEFRAGCDHGQGHCDVRYESILLTGTS